MTTDQKLLIFDVETTGLDKARDKVIELVSRKTSERTLSVKLVASSRN